MISTGIAIGHPCYSVVIDSYVIDNVPGISVYNESASFRNIIIMERYIAGVGVVCGISESLY
jgi:hypothetical protein